MVTKPTGRPRGRPPLPLRSDPDRYALVYFVALYGLGAPFGIKPYLLGGTLMVLRHGDFDAPEVRKAIVEGRPFQPPPAKIRGSCSPDAPDWKERDPYRWLADNFLRKVRELHEKLAECEPNRAPDASDDAKDMDWLILMLTVWRLALASYAAKGDPLAAAEDLAAKAGESEYFSRVIEPLFWARIPVPARIKSD